MFVNHQHSHDGTLSHKHSDHNRVIKCCLVFLQQKVERGWGALHNFHIFNIRRRVFFFLFREDSFIESTTSCLCWSWPKADELWWKLVNWRVAQVQKLKKWSIWRPMKKLSRGEKSWQAAPKFLLLLSVGHREKSFRYNSKAQKNLWKNSFLYFLRVKKDNFS